MADRAMTPEQVAEAWGCSRNHVLHLMMSRRIPSFRVGARMLRVFPSDLPEPIPENPTETPKAVRIMPEPAPGAPPAKMTVYVIRSGPYVKIGRATDFQRRLAGLRTQSPYDIEVVATLSQPDYVELILHARFAMHRHRGEWFREEGELADWIKAGCPYDPS
jgi:hypothetical protein